MTILERKQREREKRRQDIVDAAEGLFFSKGFDNVAMDDIARKVELNKATIYLYYENKESLFFAVVLRGLKTLNEMVTQKVSAEESGIKKMWGVWHAHLEFAQRYPDHFQAYMYFQSGRFDLDNIVDVNSAGQSIMPGFDSSVVINIPNGHLVKEILDLHYRIFESLCASIKSAITEGDVEDEVNPSELAAFLLITVEGSASMNPLIKNEIGLSGIGQKRFLRDIRQFLNIG